MNATIVADLRRYTAEFIGTFLLVFIGPGAVVIGAYTGTEFGALDIGIVFGLVVMVVIYAIGHISGAHINPAVTLAFAAVRHFPARLVPGYVIAQLAGATAASGVHRALFGNIAYLGATRPFDTTAQALTLELIIAFFLMFVIMAVATDVRAIGQAAAIAIGAYVAIAATAFGPVTGASMNPARSFGPALVSGTWDAHWVYWVGPVLGTLAGALVYVYLRDTHSQNNDMK